MFPFSNNTDGSLSLDRGKKSVYPPTAPSHFHLKCVFSQLCCGENTDIRVNICLFLVHDVLNHDAFGFPCCARFSLMCNGP